MSLPVMDWTDLPYFLAVARGGSLRAAADRLDASHATVDRHIRALETGYGVSLFQRSASGLALTPAGAALLPAAEQAEAAIAAARRSVSGLDDRPAGEVHLTMPSWIAYLVVAPILPEFCAAYPDIDLRISIGNRFQRLSHGEADVSVRVAHEIGDDVVARRLFRWDMAVLASQAYLDAEWDRRGPGGEGLRWIRWAPEDFSRGWPPEALFPKARRVHSVSDEMMYFHMIRNGHGIGIFPYAALYLFPGIVRVPGTPTVPDRSLWLLLHSDLRRTARVRALVDFLAGALLPLRGRFQAG